MSAKRIATALGCLCLFIGFPQAATAGDNDIILSTFGDFEISNPNRSQGTNAQGTVDKRTDLFENLVSDMGQVIAPKFGSPATTLGEAGFSLQLIPSLSFIPNDAEHWRRAMTGNSVPRENGLIQEDNISGNNPPSALFTPTVIVRKGLPYSFEFGGSFSHIAGSNMFTVGSQVQWALNEGFKYFPDVSVRGTVNTLMGSRDLNLMTAGGDVTISKGFDIGGVMSVAPYAGYQRLWAIGWSRLLNARPQDPRSPQSDQGGNTSFNPEFVFSTHVDAVNRLFVGADMQVWILDIALEGAFSENVQQVSLSTGLNF
jgi:hypothetical protein